MGEPRELVGRAVWPADLEDLVSRAHGFPGWEFELRTGDWDDDKVHGWRLIITVPGHDGYQPDRRRTVEFHHQVPITHWCRADWQRWIFDRCMDVWRHETGEFLRFAYDRPDETGDPVTVEERPFAPFHGPGRDPNRNVEVGVDPMEVRVQQEYLGGRYPGWWWNGQHVHDDETHDRCIARGVGRACTPVKRT